MRQVVLGALLAEAIHRGRSHIRWRLWVGLSQVCLHPRGGHGSEGAQGTPKGLLPRVSTLMAPQVAVLGAPEVAVGALVGLGARVGALMLTDLSMMAKVGGGGTGPTGRP